MSGKNNYVDLKVTDGAAMAAYVARPEGSGKHPGIIVFQEAFGVNAYIRDVTGRFAREGFTAIAPELFHRTGPGFFCDQRASYNEKASKQAWPMTLEFFKYHLK